MNLLKKCWNCSHWCVCESICKSGMSIGLCSDKLEKWDGWISKDTPPTSDEYVLIQLTEDYAGSLDNVCIGMYIPADNKWLLGHIRCEYIDAKNIYAWRELPHGVKE